MRVSCWNELERRETRLAQDKLAVGLEIIKEEELQLVFKHKPLPSPKSGKCEG